MLDNIRAARKQFRRSKYNATKTVVDGITFASKAEGKRFAELRLLERAGEIKGLRCQEAFPLMAPNIFLGSPITIGKYVTDFFYYDKNDERVVEDVKGFKTPLYRWKKKHVEAQYGIKIVEIK
jgi:hypothetical protein